MSAPRHVPQAELRRLLDARDRAGLLDLFSRYPLSGGADEPEPLYPEIPDAEGIQEMSDDEIDELLDRAVAVVERVGARDPDVVEGIDAATLLAETRAAVEGIERLRGERQTRDDAAAEVDAELAELTGRVVPAADPEPDPADDPAAAVVEGDPDPAADPAEPVAASARRRRPVPARRERHAPQPAQTAMPTITAASEGPLGGPGTLLPTLRDVAALMIDRRERMGNVRDGDRMTIATVRRPLTEERTLSAGDGDPRAALANQQKIDAVINPQAIAAAGGICVMPTPRYEVQTFGTLVEPVRDGLPSFNADRGGIAWYPPVSFAEVSSAIGVITNQEALSGGSPSLKTCQTLTCPPTSTAVVDSRYRCVEINNLEARTFPERVEAFIRNVMVAQAQLAEVDALAEIDAATIAVTGGPVFGALNDVLGILSVQRASIASAFRLDPEAPMRLIAPSWLPDFLLQDLFRQGFDPARYAIERARLLAQIRALGFNVTESLDAQLIAQSGAGVTVSWPATVVFRLFPEGAYLRLDSGTLDLGLVRDSTLNTRNAYQLFAETFEKIIFVGLTGMARKITVTTRPTGVTGVNTSATVPTPTY